MVLFRDLSELQKLEVESKALSDLSRTINASISLLEDQEDIVFDHLKEVREALCTASRLLTPQMVEMEEKLSTLKAYADNCFAL